jgi:16S rRNA processing protein RimM
MNKGNDYVIVGKIGTTYGIKGWLKIHAFSSSVTNMLDYVPWYLEENKTWKAIKISEAKTHGKGIIAHIDGFDSPEKARLLTGKNIAVKRSQLAPLKKNEYYWADLEGLTVINQHGETLGKIIYLMETGSNDVLVIKGEKEHAIPFLLDEVIVSVDLDKKEMRVNWDLI